VDAGARLLATRRGVPLLLQQARRHAHNAAWIFSVLWDPVQIISIAEVACSREGLTNILAVIRQCPDIDISLLQSLVDSPAIKEVLWELGGIDILLATENLTVLIELLPFHSREAVIQFACSGGLRKLEALCDDYSYQKCMTSFAKASMEALAHVCMRDPDGVTPVVTVLPK
jgi:hypothetical protein